MSADPDPVIGELAAAWPGLDETARRLLAAAWWYGHQAGWVAGFDRSFEENPGAGLADQPTMDELDRLRGEVRMEDGTRRALPQLDNYQGGPVPPW